MVPMTSKEEKSISFENLEVHVVKIKLFKSSDARIRIVHVLGFYQILFGPRKSKHVQRENGFRTSIN